MKTALVVGIGNAWRGDDAAGLMVADLVDADTADVAAVRHEGDGAALLDLWAGYEMVVLVDAIVSGAPPGTIRRFRDRHSLPRPWFGGGSHLINVTEAVDLARTLGRLPPQLLVIGIEGRSFQPGDPMSAEVEASVRRVADDLATRIADGFEVAG
ncbi:MAG TPA: hydrogenase maturation protease [Armatimonadota bacterium]|jgi:hydrogenase maturation protease